MAQDQRAETELGLDPLLEHGLGSKRPTVEPVVLGSGPGETGFCGNVDQVKTGLLVYRGKEPVGPVNSMAHEVLSVAREGDS